MWNINHWAMLLHKRNVTINSVYVVSVVERSGTGVGWREAKTCRDHQDSEEEGAICQRVGDTVWGWSEKCSATAGISGKGQPEG